MDLSSFFLVTFVVALGLTLVTFALGIGGHGFGGHVIGHSFGHASASGGLHVPAVGQGTSGGAGHAGGHGPSPEADSVSPFNMATLFAFFTWFGGVGYMLTTYFGLGTVVALLGAAMAGLVGGGAIFFFLARVLIPNQTPFMDRNEAELMGTIGHLSTGIRLGGTGELVYEKGGTRHVASARSDQDEAIVRGTQVVVMREERGIAYVRTVEALLGHPAEDGH